jgi:ATP-dependent RNA helicase RhlE
MEFTAFKFHPKITAGITAAGYVTPTPIQAQAIPPVLDNRDVMGLAQTGTGKTAAFALPILNRLLSAPGKGVRALIIAPTRELAEQIHVAISELGQQTGLHSATIYGGVGINPQIAKLKRGVDIVVACPGRLLDHIRQKTIDLSRLEVLVLDEADQMFDMGFFPDIRRILQQLPAQRQTLLFSATMPAEIRRLANDVLRDPVTIQADTATSAETVQHALYPVRSELKSPLLLQLLQTADSGSVLVFTRTKHRAKRLGEQLVRAGHTATSLQGNLSQNRRQEALDGFRQGTFRIMVATDIAARGIDVSQVTHVINYDVPMTPEAYVHRIGRTGRAARSGDAYTLVSVEDTAQVRAIERLLGKLIARRTLDGFDYTQAPPAAVERPRTPRSMPTKARPKTAATPGTPQARQRRRRPRAASPANKG